MSTIREIKLVTRYFPLSLALITIFVSTGIGPDPVNLPKLTLMVISVMFFFGLSYKNIYLNSQSNKKLFYITIAFLIGLIFSLILGQSNWITNFYGTWARNTGALTYLMLVLIFLISSSINEKKFIHNTLLALYFAGIVNLSYAVLYAWWGKDIIAWNNRYDKFLSTLGNPNFGSSFLALAYAVGLYYVLDASVKKKYRMIAFLLSPGFIFAIISTGSLQGLLLVAISTGLYGYSIFVKRIRSKLVKISGLFGLFIISIFSVLGMLQIGPLQNYLYKPSVSIRGAYWRAAWRMFESSPIYGLGLDSYGNFYRRNRDLAALNIPGVDVVTDSAHNVFLDLLAGGGALIFIPYVLLQILVACKLIQIYRYKNDDTWLPIALGITWVCWLSQSIISINQIGLAIWGWVIPGTIIAYERILKQKSILEYKQSYLNKSKSHHLKSQKLNQNITAKSFAVSTFTSLIGILLILPVQTAEARWQSALRTKSVEKIMKAADQWPRSCGRYMLTYNIFAGTDLTQEALTLLLRCRDINSDFFTAHFLLTQFSWSKKELEQIYSELHRLDPLNPAYANNK